MDPREGLEDPYARNVSFEDQRYRTVMAQLGLPDAFLPSLSGQSEISTTGLWIELIIVTNNDRPLSSVIP